MKTSEIEDGAEYVVHVDERTSLCYGGCDLRAKVVRHGFHYEVETVTGSRIRNAPYKRYSKSEHPSGVEIKWDEQQVWSNRRGGDQERIHAGRAIVNSRAVKYRKDTI